MVQIAFFLRFRSQLQRVRPELIPHLEDTAARAVRDAGGKIIGDRGFLQAVFDETSLGFWLDMLLFIETLTQALEKAAIDLQGYSLLLGKVLPDTPQPLCRFLSGERGGIFFDQTVSEAMRPYITVEEQGKRTIAAARYGMGSFFRLNEIKIFVPTGRIEFPLNKPSVLSDPGQRPVVLVPSQSFEGKRDKLYLRVAGFANSGDSGEFPPLFVRFGSGSLNALIDSWEEWMQQGTFEEEIYSTWEFLFRQRLMDKPSPFALRTARRFFKLLIGSYCDLARAEGKNPVIILENIQNAGQATTDIAIEALRGSFDCLLVGTYAGDMNDMGVARWKSLFPQLTSIGFEEASFQRLPELPLDLWEIGYACLLLGRYFPSGLLPDLLEESGKSPLVISRALSLLYALRVIDTPLDPRPWHQQFQYRAESVLGEKKNGIQALVRGCLLAWVTRKKIDPCLRLLEILKELNPNEEIDDSLILRSIHGELAYTRSGDLESIRCNGILNSTAGPGRSSILHYILETLLALHSGEVQNIHAAFASHPPECESRLLSAQALLNQSLYYMGLRDHDSSAEGVKEASLLCKGSGGSQNQHGCLAQAYRLFALESLSRRRIGETIDYLGFSLENAGKSGGYQDIGMAAYYAASIQMLSGNLSRSQTLADKAHRHFLKAGNPEWADRSRFLLGRLSFEIGSYQKAIDIFENLRQNPEGEFSPEKIALLEAWAYRAKVCSEPQFISRPACEGRDADLFEIESLCLAGNAALAAELSGILARFSRRGDFLCIERPDWRTGFAQCELLFFTWDDLRDRLLCAYNSIAQTRQSKANGEEAIRAMQQILRGNQFPEIDPYDVFYHYAWYRVLEQSGASQVDISTAVSVAFKRLQSRAARIDDMDIRHEYLTQPRWNQALEQAAKEFKLI